MRTVVYDEPLVQEHYADIVSQKEKTKPEGKGLNTRERRTARQEAEQRAEAGESAPQLPPDETQKRDDYLAKLAKYVPAEVISISALGFGVFDVTGDSVWLWLGVGAVINIVYLMATAFAQPPSIPRPRAYFYVLSASAYILWAMATIDSVQAETGIDDAAEQGFILAFAAFVIPLIDSLFTGIEAEVVRRRGTTPDAPPNGPGGGSSVPGSTEVPPPPD